jgi:hypothetical protein
MTGWLYPKNPMIYIVRSDRNALISHIHLVGYSTRIANANQSTLKMISIYFSQLRFKRSINEKVFLIFLACSRSLHTEKNKYTRIWATARK